VIVRKSLDNHDGSFKLQNVATELFLQNNNVNNHIIQTNETNNEMEYFYIYKV
jgi:hypothetical protein